MLTKVCTSCGVEKAVDQYDVQKAGRYGVRAKCKPCVRAYMRDYYDSNREAINRRNSAATKEARQRNRQWLVDYLRDHPCVDCGDTRLPVLQFDHRDPDTKLANVSHLAHRSHSLETLRVEVAKCDVRCANCHAMRTASQFGWFKLDA